MEPRLSVFVGEDVVYTGVATWAWHSYNRCQSFRAKVWVDFADPDKRVGFPGLKKYHGAKKQVTLLPGGNLAVGPVEKTQSCARKLNFRFLRFLGK